eukprot:m.413078 g.413078  ORF g.413078 m.413078 type:complete len:63 (-) comp56573_c0_seq1:136-324(-)
MKVPVIPRGDLVVDFLPSNLVKQVLDGHEEHTLTIFAQLFLFWCGSFKRAQSRFDKVSTCEK